jgi:lycopene beta-cyclase
MKRGQAELETEHLIVGGGLAGGLIALALANAGRGARVTLIESEPHLGGNHTWSFHFTDLGEGEWDLVAPLVVQRWGQHEVRFPGHERVLHTGYATITGQSFAEVVTGRLVRAGVRVLLDRRVAEVGPSAVRFEDRSQIHGQVVIDARGPDALPGTDLGYQKFVGLELSLESDGPWTRPLLMDATVSQHDGYRFVYLLPFSARHVLVEDTTYSSSPRLDGVELERRIVAYVGEHGVRVGRVLRRESGVLPLPLNAGAAVPRQGTAIAVGYRGGFFHPVTGYSLPLAARVALAVATARTPEETVAAVGAIARRLVPQRRFGQLLNRLMFEAMAPASRWTALDRFYRLPEATIARFYASASTWGDRARILIGRPPAGLSWRYLLGRRLVRARAVAG